MSRSHKKKKKFFNSKQKNQNLNLSEKPNSQLLHNEKKTVHQQFKQFVSEHRPRMDIDQIATGEHWLAAEAKKLGLVDELKTSDDYLLSQFENKQVIKVAYHNKKGLADRFSNAASLAVENAIYRVIETCKIPF